MEVVAAFDIDKRKVGKDIAEAIFQPPNCTHVICADIPGNGTIVNMGPVLDGFAAHMEMYDEQVRFVPAKHPEPSKEVVVKILRRSGAEILLNYMPVGAEKAAAFYAECALLAGIGFVNNMPVFIASNPEWSQRFAERNIPLIGDDIKSQLGATIVHRVLTNLFQRRGVKLDRTYQLNTGGNTDFLNMLDRSRLALKKISKTESVQSQITGGQLPADDIHIGPSDWVPWQKDNKVCFIRMEGRLFGESQVNIEMRLSVEDSPNSSGVVIDAVRCCKLALDRGQGGVLSSPSAFFMKHPPQQYTDDQAYAMTEEFIAGNRSH